MHDPYTPTRYASAAAPTDAAAALKFGVQWRRVLLGGVVLFSALATWSIGTSMLLSLFLFRFAPDDVGFASFNVVRTSGYILFATIAYWWFSTGIARWRWLHLLLAWVLVQSIGAGILKVLLDVTLDYSAWKYWASELLPVCAAWSLAWLWPGRGPRSARGAH